MKLRKFLATTLVAAMAITMIPAPELVRADEIEGGTIYVEQDIYDVVLPTTEAQKFYLDPNGLIALGLGGASTANEGTIVGKNPMYAINRSSKPVALSASYKLVDSATSNGVTVVSNVSDPVADVQNGSDLKVAVSVSANEVHSAPDSDGIDVDYPGHVFKAPASGTTDITGTTGVAGDAVYAGSAAATATYLMTAETYKPEYFGTVAENVYDSAFYRYVVDEENSSASCLKLEIGGYCTKAANWKDYASGAKTLKLDVVFRFKQVTSSAGDYTDAVASTLPVGGPSVTFTAGGLITIAGLTEERNFTAIGDVKVVNGSQENNITVDTVTWDDSAWSADNGGTFTFQLKPAWGGWNGESISVKVNLKDGTSITSNAVTLDVN